MSLLQPIIFVWFFFRVCATICFLKIVFASFVSPSISVINEPHSHPRYTEGIFLKIPDVVFYNQRVWGFRVKNAELLHSSSIIMYVLLLSYTSVGPLLHQKFLGFYIL